MYKWEIRKKREHRKKEGKRIVGLDKRTKRNTEKGLKKENKRSRKKTRNRKECSQRVQKYLRIHLLKEELAKMAGERRFKEKDRYQGKNNNMISKECQREDHQGQDWR